MKTLLNLRFVFLLSLLFLPDLCIHLAAQSSSSNPIMIIRCRDFSEEQITNKSDAKVFFDGTDNVAFTAPQQTCYEGDFEMSITDVDCDSPNPITSATLCFTPAPGEPAFEDGDYITFTDLANCLNFLEDENIQELDDLYDLQAALEETYSFGPAVDGKITVPEGVFINRDAPVVMTLAGGGTVSATADCDAIPTMSQWALLILALMISSLGLVYISRKKLA